ncbi:MAG TPA: hypothetical protein VGU45_00300, partial [Microvirga sp.]|nr:hypothetical protein [Microvirga sp.]
RCELPKRRIVDRPYSAVQRQPARTPPPTFLFLSSLVKEHSLPKEAGASRTDELAIRTTGSRSNLFKEASKRTASAAAS